MQRSKNIFHCTGSNCSNDYAGYSVELSNNAYESFGTLESQADSNTNGSLLGDCELAAPNDPLIGDFTLTSSSPWSSQISRSCFLR